jgi:hypothetical protein
MFRNDCKPLICIRDTDILRLPSVNPAPQRPAAIFIHTVIDISALAEKAFSAKCLYIDRNPVSRLYSRNLRSHGFHDPHHLMAHRDPRHRSWNRPVLDMQIAGADAG